MHESAWGDQIQEHVKRKTKQQTKKQDRKLVDILAIGPKAGIFSSGIQVGKQMFKRHISNLIIHNHERGLS